MDKTWKWETYACFPAPVVVFGEPGFCSLYGVIVDVFVLFVHHGCCGGLKLFEVGD